LFIHGWVVGEMWLKGRKDKGMSGAEVDEGCRRGDEDLAKMDG
jgi:hypothetical protein